MIPSITQKTRVTSSDKKNGIEPVNRLFLIGNGFDCAHGLQTSYNHFILWYVTYCFTQADEKGEYNDPLINIHRHKHISIDSGYIKTFKDYLNHFYECGFSGLDQQRIHFKNTLNTNVHNPYAVNILSGFFRRLLSKCSNTNWVEIENEYYTFLKEILYSEKLEKRSAVLEDLHTRFAFIIQMLEKYLVQIPVPEPIEGYRSIIDGPILARDIVSPVKMKEEQLPNETLILNFNYTPTINAYFPKDPKFVAPYNLNKRINFIHGELSTPENPIIFGFGDELDKDYEKMELEKSKGFFAYIKSFWYFKTSNYHNMIRFIDSGKFQICVLGHSCGLSDRTMLNMIFEHSNCISIKIYYHGNQNENNYTEITQNISRHFRNKPDMRKKIVPFDKTEPMPQAINDY
ncbi:hypothetical protein DBR11_26485 [Pedobacter sp. HMWF019]|uniref:AbiH family protein n=1 Tax=Pedobacter sp. HMWF019 TaxID=2056856 RepID=UPI000D3D5B02|nr:AbiH family protein [Pedobacter sp. HMWF019]PTS92666.1 hypothetical protein DBR11_26485 [Pedobacter sp. HMWF019]